MGIYVLGILGCCGALLAFVLSFLPPAQIKVGSTTIWYSILFIGYFVFVGIPLIIYHFRKPSWINEKSDDSLEPFSWEEKKTDKPTTQQQ